MDENSDTSEQSDNPHDGQPTETAGAPPQVAEAAVILLHGRGSSAQYMLTLIDEFLHHGVMYLAPQAAHRSWYPWSGAAPMEKNEPWISGGIERISAALEIAEKATIPAERTLLLGFSQGGSLAAEFVARNPRRYGGLVVLSGSLLGPEIGSPDAGSLDGTPVFLGCSSEDPYVDVHRFEVTAAVFEALDGDVTSKLYDGLGHEINDDEIQAIDSLVESLV